MCFITPTSLSYRRNFGTAFRSERNERTELRQEERTATDAELARRFPAVEPGEYTRVCHLIEKHIYGEILLSPYEERTLNHFLEKLMEPVPGCSWKMRLKLRYACLLRVNTKKKKRKHSAFQQK